MAVVDRLLHIYGITISGPRYYRWWSDFRWNKDGTSNNGPDAGKTFLKQIFFPEFIKKVQTA
jgi:hypothetical protein